MLKNQLIHKRIAVEMQNKSIAIAVPLSGARKAYGEMCKQIIENIIYEKQLQNKIKIYFFDDEANPDKAIQVANQIIELNTTNKIDVVIGHFNSLCALKTQDIYAHNHIPLLLPASTDIKLKECKNNYVLCADNREQIQYLLEKFYTKNSIIVYDNSSYADKLLSELNKEIKNGTYINITKLSELNNISTDIHEIILFMPHYVASQAIEKINFLLPQKESQATIICMDDCYINEFIDLIFNIKNLCIGTQNIKIINSHPSFTFNIQQAFYSTLYNKLDGLRDYKTNYKHTSLQQFYFQNKIQVIDNADNLNLVKELSNIFDRYRVFYKQESNLELAFNFLHERLANKQSTIFYIKDKEQIIAFAQVYYSFSSVKLTKKIILNDLFVDERCRKNGISTMLMQHLYEYAVLNGYISIELETAYDNFSAQGLYKKLNYQIESEDDNQYLKYSLNLR